MMVRMIADDSGMSTYQVRRYARKAGVPTQVGHTLAMTDEQALTVRHLIKTERRMLNREITMGAASALLQVSPATIIRWQRAQLLPRPLTRTAVQHLVGNRPRRLTARRSVYCTMTDLATLWGVSRQTVYTWRERQKFAWPITETDARKLVLDK